MISNQKNVVIKNFSMPCTCFLCPFLIINANFPRCVLSKLLGKDESGKWEDINVKRMDWCLLKNEI